jgi:hypothetical protein
MSDEVSCCGACGHPLHTTKSADRIEALTAELAKAVEGLGNIARQKKTAQIEAKGETEFSDYEGAYDMCIDVARATLAELEGTHAP